MWKLSKCGNSAGFLVLEGDNCFFSSSFFFHLLLIRFCLTYMKFDVVFHSTGDFSSLTCLLVQTFNRQSKGSVACAACEKM